MADAFKVLGQVAPAAVVTTLYTVPGGKSAVVSTVSVCNTTTTAKTFRIAVRPAGAALALVHYLYYEATIGGNVTFAATIGITLAATDVLTVDCSASGLVFHAYGNEVT